MKEDPCEIYVRNSGGSNLLHRYGNSASLATHSAGGEPVAFLELSVLPKWITDADQRKAYEALGDLIHLRIPVHSVSGFR